MSSFKDRFKDKATVVGRQGEGAMLVETKGAPPPAGKSTKAPAPTVSGSAPAQTGQKQTGPPPPMMMGLPAPPPAPPQPQPKHASPVKSVPAKGGPLAIPVPQVAPGKGKSMPMPMALPVPPAMPQPQGGAPPHPAKALAPSAITTNMPPPLAKTNSTSTITAKRESLKVPATTLPMQSMLPAPVQRGMPRNEAAAEPDPIQRYNYRKGEEEQPSHEEGEGEEDGDEHDSTPTKRRAFGQAPPPKFPRRAISNPPRPTDPPPEVRYKVKTIEEWREVKNKPQEHRGGLGPSDTDEQRLYKILRRKAAEYGDDSNRINMAVLAAEPKNPLPLDKPLSKQQVELNERRRKALEFAKHVPKPKPKSDPADATGNSATVLETSQMSGETLPPRKSPRIQVLAPEAAEVIAEREAQHEKDQEMIESIKRQLKIA